MHGSVKTWAADVVRRYGLGRLGDVLDVGSLDVNGSLRGLFLIEGVGDYLGVDLVCGRGVDQVASAHALPFDTESFQVVVCTEMLEHDTAPWLSIREMHRVLKADGFLILSTRGNGFPEHDFPGDCWRFMKDGVYALVENWAGFRIQQCVPDPEVPGWFVLARK